MHSGCIRLSVLVWLLAAPGALHGAGPLQRVSNTSLAMPPAPPALAYTWTNALNGMNFTNPVCITSPPGETNRLFILEKLGRIVVITNLASPTRTIFLDIRDRVQRSLSDSSSDEQGLLAMAFHPGYATNSYFYVWYTGSNVVTSQGTGRHDVLSRFQTTATNANVALTNSELRLFTQYDEANNHNGGDLHFGPADGYLYLTMGDEGMHFGDMQNCQLIDKDFFAAMLRIDADKRPGNLEPNPHPAVQTNGSGQAYYSIPIDNPFVHTSLGGDWDGTFNGDPIPDLTKVHSEFWVTGLRHPFRFSFSPIDGTLYEGDVGEQAREEVNIIERGKNYGWNWYEGELLTTTISNWTGLGPTGSPPAGLVNTLPLYSYAQDSPGDSVAIIGGHVYTGQRLSQLYGAYIFGDYGYGFIRALRHNGTNVTDVSTLFTDDITSGTARITTFGVDPGNGDILYADVYTGRNSRIKRIIASTNANPNAPQIPATLADTGAFANLATLTPQPGVVPYTLNVPFWSDNAIKTRWFSLPDTNLTVGFSRDGNWSFPTGAVWIKHFELELTNSVPASRKRLETRFIVRNDDGVYGVTYRWGNSLTNATLVAEEGLDEPFVIDDGGGILRTQVWHYPSRVQCLQCHTEQGGFALGFNTPQLNCDFDYDGTNANQVLALSGAGYFSTNVTDLHTLRALAPATNNAVSLEYRVRSYFAANCSQCHQGDNGLALWDARITTPTALAGIIEGALVNNFGNSTNRVVKPGSLAHSVLFARLSTAGGNRMPPLDSTVLDTQAIALVAAWITNALPDYQSFADWQSGVGWTNAPDADAMADPDGDGAVNYLEYLTGTDPLAGTNYWRLEARREGTNVAIVFPQIANRGFEVEYAPELTGPITWNVLDVPGNKPFFSVTNFMKTVADVPTNGNERFYRVRIFAP